MKKFGFTLAETLIALAIVGLVAALTIPPLMQRYNEYVTVNKVKKFYSLMNKAYQMSTVDNGRADEWKVGNGDLNATTVTQLASYIVPYLKISKDCATRLRCLGYKNGIKYLNNSGYTRYYDDYSSYYKIILQDSSVLWFRASYGTYCKTKDSAYTDACGAFWYDTNGNKGPNTLGRDIFQLILTPNGFYYNKDNDCSKTSLGWGCGGYIIQNGNMNYLH